MAYILKLKKSDTKLFKSRGGVIKASGNRPLIFEQHSRAVKAQTNIIDAKAKTVAEKKALKKLISIKKL